MIDFNYKKCLCNTENCGKCLFLGCTDDNCAKHRQITKWRYRKNKLAGLIKRLESLGDKDKTNELLKDIEILKSEIERPEEVLGMKK